MQLVFLKWIILWFFFATLGSSKDDEEKNHQASGYYCGNEFFSNQAAEYYAGKGFAMIGTISEYPKQFKGSLYDDRLKYYIWPLFQFRNVPNAIVRPYFVVFDLNPNVIDVVTQMGNQEFIKCLRVPEARQITANNAHEDLNGHQCPGKFFHDDFVLKSATMSQQIHAHSSEGSSICKSSQFKGSQHFVCPLMEELVEKYELEYNNAQPMHPSFDSKALAIPGGLSSLYNVIINTNGKVADVVVALLDGSFMSCPRARGLSYIAKIRSPDQRIKKENGYQCMVQFFDDEYLKSVSEFLKSGSKASRKSTVYPKKYTKSRNSQEHWMWPLLPRRKIYTPVRNRRFSVYFAIMSPKFDVIRVVEIKVTKEERECPRRHGSVIS